MNWSIPSVAAIWVGGVGFLALVSFVFNFPLLLSEFLQTSLSLKPSIAFSFLLFSLVLKFLQTKQPRQGFKYLAQVCSFLNLGIGGVLTIGEYSGNWNLNFEQGVNLNNISLFILPYFLLGFESSGVKLISLAIVLLLLIHKTPKRIKIAQAITGIILAIETTNLITFLFSIPLSELEVLQSQIGILLETISFILLCLGILWIYPHRGFLRTFTHRSVNGIQPYKLLGVILFLVFIKTIILSLQSSLPQNTAFLDAVQTVLEISGFLGFVGWMNNRSYAVHLRCQRLEQQLKRHSDRKQALVELQQREQDFQALVENSPDIISRVDGQFRFDYVNPKVAVETGIPASDWIGKTELELGFPEEIVLPWHQVLQQVFETGEEQLYETEFPAADGTLKYWQCRIVPEFNHQGIVESALTVSRDITERKSIEEALRQCVEYERLLGEITDRIRQSLELDQILATAVAEVQQIIQADRVFIYRFNPDWSGTIVTESIVAGFMSILDKSCKDSYLVETRAEVFRQGNIQVVNDVYATNLTPCHQALLIQLQIRASLLLPICIFSPNSQREKDSQTVWGLLGINSCVEPREWQTHDIEFLNCLTGKLAIAVQQSALYEQLQKANQKLQYLAHYDQLTQVANRRYFDEYFEQEWHRLSREQAPLSLILCDVDYFKCYNDTYGHLAGDRCLVEVAQAISRGVKRPADLVARYGGEEFVVILPNTNAEGAIEVVRQIQNIINNLNLPHSTSLAAQQITLSFGIACVYPSVTSSTESLINQADKALYQAKDAGRNGYFVIEF